jgi:hypothetical protein
MNKIKRHCEIQTFSRSLNNKVHGNGTFGFKKNEKLNLTNEPKTQEITLDLEIIFFTCDYSNDGSKGKSLVAELFF